MTTDLHAILTDVAEGRLDPTEAGRLLADTSPGTSTEASAEASADADADAVTETPTSAPSGPSSGGPTGAGPTAAPSPDAATPRPPSSDQAVQRVVVRATGRSVRIVGDVTVGTATVEGPHSVRQSGADLVVGAPEPATEPGTYSYEPPRSTLSRWLAESSTWGTPLTARVNPVLPVDVEVVAGSLRVSGLHAPLRARLTAGSLVVADCSGSLDGVVRAGAARLDTRPVGESTLRVESGSADLRLLPGSDVRVHTRGQLGEVWVRGADGAQRKVPLEGGEDVVVGAGTNRIELDVVMGSAKVALP